MATPRKTAQSVDLVEFGRVMERLDQQDRHTARIAAELAESTGRIATDLAHAVALQGATQKEILVKVEKVLLFQERQKGAVSVLLLAATAVSAVVGWVVSYFSR